MMRLRPALLLCLLALSTSVTAAKLSGRVGNVYSGRDIAILTAPNGRHLVQLRGIRLSDQNPALRRAAQRRLNGLIGGRLVQIAAPSGTRQAGKLSAYVRWGSKEINLELVTNGLAIIHEAELDPSRIENYRAAQAEAQQRGLGIWAKTGAKPRLFIRKH
jgi:endonuclease YncB( thermonuclease family)